MNRMLRSMWVAIALMCFASTAIVAQQNAKKPKSMVLKGKVEEVNESSKTLTVNHDKVEGYMDAMTMPYKVDKPEVLKKVKKGDMIKATVYPADYTLYDVQVLPPGSK